jgi:hypothetical protein
MRRVEEIEQRGKGHGDLRERLGFAGGDLRIRRESRWEGWRGRAVEVHASCVTPLRKMTRKGKKDGLGKVLWMEFDWV